MKRRRGFSLVELTVVGTAGFVLVMLATTTFRIVASQSNRIADARLNCARLADRLRRDIHAAERFEGTQAEQRPGPLEFTLFLPDDREATYRYEATALVRLEHKAGDEGARDTFPLPENTHLKWQQVPKVRGDLAAIVVQYPLDSAANAQRRELIISAQLGRDYRWRNKP